MSTKQELERLDDRTTEAFNRHDVDTFLNVMADDFEWIDDAAPQPIRSREEARRYVESFFASFPDISLRETSRVIGDDAVAGEVEYSGTNRGPLQFGDTEMPPTGKSMTARGSFFFKVQNGKIKELHTYADNLGMMSQLGLAPEG